MLTKTQISAVAEKHGMSYASAAMIADVEGSGKGYGSDGRLLIQFEPAWFKRLYSDWKKNAGSSVWINNGVREQAEEYKAFFSARKEDTAAAIQATSVGCMQVMCFHYEVLGFKSPGAMWDFAKESESNQLELGLLFIGSVPRLRQAVLANDFDNIANYYNGFGYKELARRTHTVPYNLRLRNSYLKFGVLPAAAKIVVSDK